MPGRPFSLTLAAMSTSDQRARLPPGQHLAKEKFPVLDLGIRPKIDPARWSLEVGGLVAMPLAWSWAEFEALPRVEATSDFHCVTTWTVLDAPWGGVPMDEVLRLADPRPEARFALFTCYDGYTTNVPLEALRAPGVLLADRLEGRPLPVKHGGPVRVVIPQLYAWKSAKFIRRIDLLATDEPGYWEKRGYSDTACPWREERFRRDPAESALGF